MINLQTLSKILFQISDNEIYFGQLFSRYIFVLIAAVVICFLTAEFTRNYSQVDKLWSIMPLIYGGMTLIYYPSPRILIMCCLVAIWGIRLTFNFYRKGGYNIVPWKGEEDYRWKFVRQNPKLKGKIRLTAFNLVFISFYQQLLILLFSSPFLIAARYNDSGISLTDIVAAFLMLVFIITEAIADNQQFRFQKLKRQMEHADNQMVRKGFLSGGLWHFVRHPNYASEQAIWMTFYLFGVSASGRILNWTLIGPILLILLFMGSTALTENISNNKYPDYPEYVKTVPKFIPRVFTPKIPKGGFK